MAEVRRVRGLQLNYVLPTAIDRVVIVPDVADVEIHAAIDAIARHPLLAHCVEEESCEIEAAAH